MAKEIRSQDQHMLERVADLVIERLERRAEFLIRVFTAPDGRPVGTVKLTAEEQLARYLDSTVLPDRLAALTDEDVVRYYEDMQKLRGAGP